MGATLVGTSATLNRTIAPKHQPRISKAMCLGIAESESGRITALPEK